jgi:hypothetical protein
MLAAFIFLPLGILIAFKAMDIYRATEGSAEAKDKAINAVASHLDKLFPKQ